MSHAFNLIIVGQGGCGKTSYATKIQNGTFSEKYVATIGYDKFKVTFKTNRGEELTFNGYDFDGQSNHSEVTDIFKRLHCALVFYDLSGLSVS